MLLNLTIVKGMQTCEEPLSGRRLLCSKACVASSVHRHRSDETTIGMSIVIESDCQPLETSKIAVEIKPGTGA